ncbi:MAG: hypothetical protein IJZ79_02835 [Bacilli bacterium]|nr:hypothetical protein [Bacilli bacterium]MBQ8218661.1 hypothetical protein [Bacilli bacterium]
MKLDAIMKLSYSEYIVYLKIKYGMPSEPYFCGNNTLKYNSKNSRTNEGLMIHHVYENRYVYLSNPNVCEQLTKDCPETQSPENLVYCNFIEHLILHIKITEELNGDSACGWGGIISIMQHINSLYNYYYIDANINFNNADVAKFRINCFNEIVDKLNEYLYLVDYIMDNVLEKIINCSDGIISTADLWSVYEDNKSFSLVSARVKVHSKYTRLNKLSYTLRNVSNYKSLSDLYRNKYNITRYSRE